MTSISDWTAGASVIDPRWEFNAPKYVDLSKLPTEGPEDDGADAWFESPEALAVLNTPRRAGAAAQAAAHGGASPALGSSHKRSAAKSAGKTPAVKEVAAEGQDDASNGPSTSQDAEAKGPVTRLMAKLVGAGSPREAAKQGSAEKPAAAAERGTANASDAAQPGPGSAAGAGPGNKGEKQTAAERLARWKAAGAAGHGKDKRPAADAAADEGTKAAGGKPIRRATEGGVSKQQGPAADAQNDGSAQADKRGEKRVRPAEVKQPAPGARITIPKSPKLRSTKRVRGPSVQLTSEELAMQEARLAAEQETKRRKLQNERAHKIHGAAVQQPAAAAAAEAQQEWGRSASRVMVTRSMVAAEPFVSLAERLHAMQTKTPERFKKNPSAPPPKTDLRPTQPRSPRLQTRNRVRGQPLKSSEELELEKIAAVPKFRARPVRAKAPAAAGAGAAGAGEEGGEQRQGRAAAPAKRLPTQPAAFRLATEERAAAHAPPAAAEASAGAAGPSRKSQGKGRAPSGSWQPHTTVAKSPALRTRSRARATPQPEEAAPAPPAFKARPAPHFEAPAPLPKRASVPLVEPEPFALATEKRGEAHRRALSRKLQEEEERLRTAAQFHAQPLPATLDAPAPLPAPPQLPLTVPQPFAMPGEALHERAVAEVAEGRRKRKAEEELARSFHARGIPRTHEQPFQPQPSAAPLTEVKEVALNSDARVTRRRAWEEQLAAKEAAAEAQRLREEKERAAREAEELKRLRKELVFKARPVPQSVKTDAGRVVPKGSSKALTEPMSPDFATNKRRKGAAAPFAGMR